MRIKRLLITLVFFTALSSEAFCEELTNLKKEIEGVKQENRFLREELEGQKALTAQLLQRLDNLERQPRAAGQADMQPIEADAVLAPEGVDMLPEQTVPKLQINGFADMSLIAKSDDAEDSNTFALGSVDLYMATELNEKLSVLVEADFYSATDTNTATFRLQRAHIKYSLSDLLNITAGRMHTALGYWNQTYHHGPWLQTTVFRPDIYFFEADDGGYLPVHAVGVELSGVKEFDWLDASYNLGIFNGRGRTVTEVQMGKDKNDSKAVNFMVSLKPQAIPGLTAGGSVYVDTIPANPPTANRRQDINEVIAGAHLTYVDRGFEVLAEVFEIRHEDQTLNAQLDALGYYIQGSYRKDVWTPYYRFDSIEVPNEDPYFGQPRSNDRTRHTLGLRWDVYAWNALKFEYSYADHDERIDEHQWTLNSSYAF